MYRQLSNKGITLKQHNQKDRWWTLAALLKKMSVLLSLRLFPLLKLNQGNAVPSGIRL